MYAWAILMAKYGIKVAEENRDISSGEILRLDSEKKQFKYKKIIDIKFPIPALPVGTSWSKDIKFYFNEDQSTIGFVPAYEYYIQAFNGDWSIPNIPSPQSYEESIHQSPFYIVLEFVTDKFFNISLYIQNDNTGFNYTYNYPAYTATIRLIITFDDLATL